MFLGPTGAEKTEQEDGWLLVFDRVRGTKPCGENLTRSTGT